MCKGGCWRPCYLPFFKVLSSPLPRVYEEEEGESSAGQRSSCPSAGAWGEAERCFAHPST